ncbi:MAG: LysM peptidoglycan-binding domain-containing protein [Chitinophagales bacterium]|nr:LysM peptidoglycan-binding domain-containing protein [Chitinophagales bacterium]MCZ2394652.1 LysM peptidoglycan-binding domain-containing protein [Chitinophagales bacterium]
MEKLKFIVSLLVISYIFNLNIYAQNVVSHIVVSGETLYGIARNYKIHINDLLKANPQIVNYSIQIGDTVKIPSITLDAQIQQGQVKHSPSQKMTTQPFAGATGTESQQFKTNIQVPSIDKTVQNNKFQMLEHLVVEKQTLYAISKIYNVSIEEIKAWNHLEGNDIKVGSKLLIKNHLLNENVKKEAKAEVSPKPIVSPPVESEKKPIAPSVTPNKPESPIFPKPSTEAESAALKNVNSKSPQSQLENAFIEAKNNGLNLQSSRVTITWINTENPNMSDSYFALHKTAPVGTIIKVTNLVNKRVVFVKVIGKLPETSDNLNIGFRISSAGKKALQLNGDKAYVDAEFYN